MEPLKNGEWTYERTTVSRFRLKIPAHAHQVKQVLEQIALKGINPGDVKVRYYASESCLVFEYQTTH